MTPDLREKEQQLTELANRIIWSGKPYEKNMVCCIENVEYKLSSYLEEADQRKRQYRKEQKAKYRKVADEVVGTKKGICAGSNYIIDHNNGNVYMFSVWANKFAIFVDDLYLPRDERYECELQTAHSQGNTLHLSKQEDQNQ